MNTRTSLAVVDDSHFYTVGRKWEHGGIDCLATLTEKAMSAELKHVWLVVGTQVSKLANDPFIGYDVGHESDDWNIRGIGKDAFSYLSVRHENQTFEDHLEIGIPEYSRWPWSGDTSPKTLLATLAYLEDALGFPVAYTPAWCSLEYIKKLNAGRWSWWQPMTTDLESKGFSYADDIAKPLHWPPKGQALAIPAGATHLIRIDGNSAYAAAMIGLNVGEGNPLWADDGKAYDGKRPGFWSAAVSGVTRWDGKQLPSFAGYKWLTTDMIEQLGRMGHQVLIKCGWYWPKYHQALRSTAEGLWKLRTEWRDQASKSAAHENVHETLRVVIKAIHGKMARPDTNEHFRRRDVWAADVSRSAAMTAYRIEKIFRDYGILPVAIKDDELTYAVSDPKIFDGMLGTSKLGGFKLVEIQPVS